MAPGPRKVALTIHVASSVGWSGAIVAFIGLVLLGLTTPDAATVRGVYLVMEPTAWTVLLPLAVVSLITGIVQALGTTWGLLRHYWVLTKLAITAFATAFLLIYTKTFAAMAVVAADPDAALETVRNPSPGVHGILALLLVLTATVLSIFKPRGLTRYGWRQQREQRQRARPATQPG